jgi:hypothetical protein
VCLFKTPATDQVLNRDIMIERPAWVRLRLDMVHDRLLVTTPVRMVLERWSCLSSRRLGWRHSTVSWHR